MKIYLYIIASALLFCSGLLQAQEEVKNKAPEKKIVLDQKILFEEESRSVDTLFKNMAVVQKRSLERNHKFIFDAHLGLGISESPKSMHSGVLGIGYGLGENFEIGFSYSPFFITGDSMSVKEVRTQVLQNGSNADLLSPDPKSMMGVHVNWVFAYGKDAFGPFSLVHSDTFLKIFFNKVQYADSLSGNQLGLAIGKTYFFSKKMGMRFAFGLLKEGIYINDKPLSINAATIEPGLVYFY